MKLKVHTRVRHKEYGEGKIRVKVVNEDSATLCLSDRLKRLLL